MSERLITREEVAVMLGVFKPNGKPNTQSIAQLERNDKEFPRPARFTKKIVRYSADAVEAYIKLRLGL